MNRRDFLKVAGLTSLALFVNVRPLAGKLVNSRQLTVPSGKIYRGTPDGRIYTSNDRGRTWSLHTNFGRQYSILGFTTNAGGQIYAHLSFQSRGFDLMLAKNQKFWTTVL